MTSAVSLSSNERRPDGYKIFSDYVSGGPGQAKLLSSLKLMLTWSAHFAGRVGLCARKMAVLSNATSMLSTAMNVTILSKVPATVQRVKEAYQKARKNHDSVNVRKAVKETTDFIGDLSRLTALLSTATMIDLSEKASRTLGYIGSSTGLLCDVIDVSLHIKELTECRRNIRAGNLNESSSKLEKKKQNLALINLAKKITSIAANILLISFLTFGLSPLISLSLYTFSTAATFWSHFYNEMVVAPLKGQSAES